MTEKAGRNDPCPCGSGKKFKQCCLLKKGGSGVKKQIKAVWLNQPAQQVNLIERTFGDAIAAASALEKPPQIPEAPPEEPTVESDDKE